MTERDENIVRMRRDGVLIREICERTGVSKNTVLKVLKDAGVEYHRSWHDNAYNLPLEELQGRIINEYQDGKTMKEIADMFGVRIEAVRRILKEAGVSPSGKMQIKGITSTEQRTAAIVELRNKGLTYDQIVKELGVCKSIVYRTCKKEGVNRLTEQPSAEMENTILSLYQSGMSAKNIRKEVHKSYEYVQEVLKKHGYIKSGKEKRQERNSKIEELRNLGVPVSDIAEQVGINRFSVYHILRNIDAKKKEASASLPKEENRFMDFRSFNDFKPHMV